MASNVAGCRYNLDHLLPSYLSICTTKMESRLLQEITSEAPGDITGVNNGYI